MAVQTIYLLGTTAAAPDWFGNTQIDGSAPAAANSAFGWVPAKIALTTPYYRGRIGATAGATAAQAASWNAAQSGPVAGSGSGITTAGDCFSIGPVDGVYAAGNWVFNFRLRASTAGAIGRVNLRMWRSPNENGSGATQLLANTNGTTVTLSTSADVNSTITAALGALDLANDYLFLQLEWQETTVGSTNGCNVLFRIGTASITTTNFVPRVYHALAGDLAPSVTLAGDLESRATLQLAGNLAPSVALAADLEVRATLQLAGDLAPSVSLAGALTVNTPIKLAGGLAPDIVFTGTLALLSDPKPNAALMMGM